MATDNKYDDRDGRRVGYARSTTTAWDSPIALDELIVRARIRVSEIVVRKWFDLLDGRAFLAPSKQSPKIFDAAHFAATFALADVLTLQFSTLRHFGSYSDSAAIAALASFISSSTMHWVHVIGARICGSAIPQSPA